MAESWTVAQALDALHANNPFTIAERAGAESLIVQWLARGDSAAVYQNCEIGSPIAGDLVIVSYGSKAAQIESTEPPTTLPDGIPTERGTINWPYRLHATVVTL